MAKLTRSGVAYDLRTSPHQETVKYSNGEFITYVFSSRLYREKFNSKQLRYRSQVAESLTRRFGFLIYMDLLADIKLYSLTEKRGFLVKVNGEEIWQESDIILSGEKVMKRN